MNANLENIKDKKILVVGLGKSGIAACQAMVRLRCGSFRTGFKKEKTMWTRNL